MPFSVTNRNSAIQCYLIYSLLENEGTSAYCNFCVDFAVLCFFVAKFKFVFNIKYIFITQVLFFFSYYIFLVYIIELVFIVKLEMWANAQRDGCPVEYMWRPLFNAAKFG